MGKRARLQLGDVYLNGAKKHVGDESQIGFIPAAHGPEQLKLNAISASQTHLSPAKISCIG